MTDTYENSSSIKGTESVCRETEQIWMRLREGQVVSRGIEEVKGPEGGR